jgi:poly-beta-1,6-N-acetyl-D-glucosamine synthase
MTAWAVLFWLSSLLLLYHLVGYPALLALLAPLLGRPVCRAEFMPLISVVVPAHNEGSVIAEKLRSILASDYPADQLEVIVGEDGSTDDTMAQASSVQDSRLYVDHSEARGGKMAALNRAFQRARGDYLVFTDANAILHPQALRSLMSNFADGSIGCVCGRKSLKGASQLEANENLYWRYESWIKRNESRLGSTPSAVGELQAVRRGLFSLPGKQIINDDFAMVMNCVRQGYRAIYDPEAVTVEAGSDRMNEEYKRKSRIAAGRWQIVGQMLRLGLRRPGFVAMFLSHKLLRLLVLPLLALILIGNLGAVLLRPASGTTGWPLLSLTAPWGELALAAQAAFYLMAWIGMLLDRRGRRIKLFYFPYFFLSAQTAAMAGMFRFWSGRQSVLWTKARR